MEIVLDHKEEAPYTSTKGFPQHIMAYNLLPSKMHN
jgi:hypothetical protein